MPVLFLTYTVYTNIETDSRRSHFIYLVVGGDSGSNGRSTSCVVYIFVLNVNENPVTHDQVGGVGNTTDNEFVLALPIKNGDSVGPGKKQCFNMFTRQ